MKILHVINSLGTGGAEKLVADMAPLQRERGNTVEALLLKGGETPFRRMLENTGIRVFDFGEAASVRSPLNVFRLAPFFRRYDIVHAHLFPTLYWVAFAKALSFTCTPLVATEHSTHNRRRDIPFFRFFDRFVYGRYAELVGISQKTTAALKKYLGGMRDIATISNGADVAWISASSPSAREEIVPAKCRRILVQTASFRAAKDQDTVIRALQLLPEDVFAAFVGDGARRAECEKLAEVCGVRERCVFLGIRDDVPALLKAADIVVMSSHWEGFGLAAVEGMAAGKPVVASDVPGLAEVVGGAGILFPLGDEKALAGTIMKLIDDKDFYARIAAACSRRAADFDIRKTADAYLRIYEEVLRERAKNSGLNI